LESICPELLGIEKRKLLMAETARSGAAVKGD
jgi:hypothetical protein